jgi:hypothetical protein
MVGKSGPLLLALITLISRLLWPFFGKGRINLLSNCFNLLSRITLKLYWSVAQLSISISRNLDIIFTTIFQASKQRLPFPNHICPCKDSISINLLVFIVLTNFPFIFLPKNLGLGFIFGLAVKAISSLGVRSLWFKK